jgi:hypothetical protein
MGIIEPWEVLDLLASLVQKSLVVYEEDEQGGGAERYVGRSTDLLFFRWLTGRRGR